MRVNESIWILGDYSALFSSCYIRNTLYICIVIKTEKDSIMETTANISDNIITRSYEEYYQVISDHGNGAHGFAGMKLAHQIVRLQHSSHVRSEEHTSELQSH